MEVFDLIFIIVYFSLLMHCSVAFALYCANKDWPLWYTPATFYELTNMSWFGCIVVYILLFPFGFVFEIGGFLKWLFTVGRKN